MTPPPLAEEHRARRMKAFRSEIAFVIAMDLVGLACWYGPGLPFHPRFVAAIWGSLALHAAVFALFEPLFARDARVLQAFTAANLAIVGVVIHYSGGAASPFTFLFIAVLISRAAYGIETVLEIALAAAVYLGVVVCEAAGWLPRWPFSAEALYADRPALALVAVNLLMGILAGGWFYRSIFQWMQGRAEGEQAEKLTALERIAQLESGDHHSLVVSTLAHDIKNHMGVFSLILRELETRAPEAARGLRQEFQIGRGNVKLITSLAARLQALAAPPQEGLSCVDLWRLLDETCQLARRLPAAQTTDILLGAAPNRPVAVTGYPLDLQRVYFNLLKNAIEALESRPDPRTINVSVAAQDGRALVVIDDNGPGIPPELAARLPGERVSTKGKERGLGLLVAREVITAHQGTLEISSEPGRGASFRTALPLAQDGRKETT